MNARPESIEEALILAIADREERWARVREEQEKAETADARILALADLIEKKRREVGS